MSQNTVAPTVGSGFSPNRVPGYDLLGWRPVRALVTWAGFPGTLQALMLVAFVLLALLGWGKFTPEGVNAKLYAKANLVNLAIWGLWWPAMIWLTVLVGRAWCMVCPLEWVSSRAESLGAKLGWRQAPLPTWLARGSLAIALFAALQMLVPAVQIHRVPHYTSMFLWAALALALVAGWLYRDRAFCRGFCPVALLLSAYGRGGMLAVRPAGGGAESQCRAPNARTCRSLLNPARLNSSQDCLVCGGCLKADPSGAMQLVVRTPFARADTREPMASWPLTLFVMIVSGFVTYELCGVWKAAEPVFAYVPDQVVQALSAGAAAGWVKGLWTIVVVPLALWLVLGLVGRGVGAGRSLGETWRKLALPIAVVVAAGHMAKALEKFTSWVGFLPYAWAEPAGVQTVLGMTAKSIPQPGAWLSLETLSAIALGLVATGTLLAFREARLADPMRGRRRAVPIALLGGFYLFLVFGWGGWL
ncbi:MAG: hypothetical protein FJ387_00905 [Verrucomicrobia bacterium]|nr:hypothetical protein [Verrucomicrobiota bacterium]